MFIISLSFSYSSDFGTMDETPDRRYLYLSRVITRIPYTTIDSYEEEPDESKGAKRRYISRIPPFKTRLLKAAKNGTIPKVKDINAAFKESGEYEDEWYNEDMKEFGTILFKHTDDDRTIAIYTDGDYVKSDPLPEVYIARIVKDLQKDLSTSVKFQDMNEFVKDVSNTVFTHETLSQYIRLYLQSN